MKRVRNSKKVKKVTTTGWRKRLILLALLVLIFILYYFNVTSLVASQSRKYLRVLNETNALNRIPKLIFQSVIVHSRSRVLTQPQITFKTRASGYKHVIMSNKEQIDWVAKYYPDIYVKFIQFSYDIQRCDFWKYLILYHHGGFYFDTDVMLLQPIEKWYSLNETNYQEIDLILGIEGVVDEKKWHRGISWRPAQINNWALAAVPKHPFLKYLIDRILTKPMNQSKEPVNDVGEFAGPAALTDIAGEYLKIKYNIDIKEWFRAGGDTMIDHFFLANVRAFACGNLWSIG